MQQLQHQQPDLMNCLTPVQTHRSDPSAIALTPTLAIPSTRAIPVISPPCVSISTSSATPRRRIPLDPTRESMVLRDSYESSRRARLLAVREAENAMAAAKRKEFQRHQAAKRQQAEREAAELARLESDRLAQLALRQAEANQRAIEEAKRESDRMKHQRLIDEQTEKQRKLEHDANADERFHQALTRVHQANAAKSSERHKLLQTKQRIAESQRENRLALEKSERLFIQRTPAHIVESMRVNTPSGAQSTRGSSTHHQSPSLNQLRSSVSSSSVASTPNLRLIQQHEGDDENEFPLPLRVVPTPHPHPLSDKNTPQTSHLSRTPQSHSNHVAVTLQFTTPHENERRQTPSRCVNFNDDSVNDDKENIIPLQAVLHTKQCLTIKGEEPIPQPIPSQREPFQPLDRDGVQQRALLSLHQTRMNHLTQQHFTRPSAARGGSVTSSSSSNQTRQRRPQKAFEIVTKHNGAIVRETVEPLTKSDSALPRQQSAPSSTTSSNSGSRPSGSTIVPRRVSRYVKVNKYRKNARSTIPILTPNLAFFQNSPQKRANMSDGAIEADNVFHPLITAASQQDDTLASSKNGVAWVIPNDAQPIIRGMQLVEAHKAQRSSTESITQSSNVKVEARATEVANSELCDSVDLVQVNSESNDATIVPVDEVDTIQLSPSTANEATIPLPHGFASPIATSDTSSVVFTPVSDQEFIAAASLACASAVKMSRVEAPVESPPSTKVTPLDVSKLSILSPSDDHELDQRLNKILQRHLKEEEKMTQGIRAQLIFSPHTRPLSDDDSSDDDDTGNTTQSSPSINLFSPSVAFSSLSSPLSCGGTPPTPMSAPVIASSIMSSPTAATDLFIETINYYIEQEKIAAAKFECEVAQSRESTPNPTPLHQRSQQSNFSPRESIRVDSVGECSVTVLPIPLSHHTSVPATPAPLAPFDSVPPPNSIWQTPAKMNSMQSPSSVVPPSTDRKVLIQAFRNMSDKEFHQAQPVVNHLSITPSVIPTSTPSYQDQPYEMATPLKSASHNRSTLQQRFEQRMGF